MNLGVRVAGADRHKLILLRARFFGHVFRDGHLVDTKLIHLETRVLALSKKQWRLSWLLRRMVLLPILLPLL